MRCQTNSQGDGKDKYLKAQFYKVYNYLQKNTATNTMVSKATNVPQKNICRIKRRLEKEGKLQELHKGLCKITKTPAFYLTTNTKLFRNNYLK